MHCGSRVVKGPVNFHSQLDVRSGDIEKGRRARGKSKWMLAFPSKILGFEGPGKEKFSVTHRNREVIGSTQNHSSKSS
jgi:hypothetical protein